MLAENSNIEKTASRWIARRDAGFRPHEAAEFEQWLAQDIRHAEALARHEQAWTIFDGSVTVGKGPFLARELGYRSVRRRRRRLTSTLAAVAGLFVAASIWNARSPAEPSMPFTATAVVVLPEKRTLPDGTIIELKGGAEIDVDYGPTLRRVSLRKGEAHFQVSKDPQRDFVVVVGVVEVRAVGTAFSVQFETGDVEILVTEGRVAVGKPAAVPVVEAGLAAATSTIERQPTEIAGAHMPQFVDAGERIVVPTTGRPEAATVEVVTVSPGELTERLAWRIARIEFTGTPLSEAIALMNQHAAGSGALQLSIDPTEAGLLKLQVEGYFRATNTEAFLRLIEQTLDIEAHRESDRISLRRKR